MLEQARAGIDLALHGRFESNGFNTVPQVAGGIAVGRHFGPVLVLAHVEYGHGLGDDERNGAGSIVSSVSIEEHVHVGADTRFQIDLERDGDEPKNEADWRLQGGPLAVATLDRFSLTGGGGVAGLQYRLAPAVHWGPFVYAAVGGVF